jgi:4-amino-4-deoxy-L-arabinose transferase-like glycosyltransferase
MILDRYNIGFIALLILHFFILVFITNDFSLSYKEVTLFFDNDGVIGFLSNLFVPLFGQNDFAVRLPFILFYLGSSVLLYLLTDDYFKQQFDRLLSVAIFMMLPGVNSAALLLNESIIVIFCTLLYLYLYKVRNKEHYFLLVLFLFIDNSFAILYLALFFYAIKKRDNFLFVASLILFAVSMSIYGFEIGGRPKGYLIDTFGVYASIFSPLLFLYFFYSLYRIGIKFEKDMYWYISMTALALSFIFSLRQRILIEDFAPFVVIAIPIMVNMFLHSYRVRLKQYRTKHKIFVNIVLGVLLLNFVTLVFNKTLYLVLEKPSKHFAYDYHIAKELAHELHNNGFKTISTQNTRLQKRLLFYGIKYNNKYHLVKSSMKSDINIKYHGKIIESYSVIQN